MTARYKLGPLVALPARVKRYRPSRDEPQVRPLWIYASDPANVGLRDPYIRIEVPYEKLAPGPAGHLFRVEATAPAQLCKYLDWGASDKAESGLAVDLDDPSLAIQSGIAPTTGDPRFAAQMAYAICTEIYEAFRRALGRNPTWGCWSIEGVGPTELRQLLIRPVAFDCENAFYDPGAGSLEFGYFVADDKTNSEYVLPRGLVLTSLSRDVIAHEVTHALLDGMRTEFMRDTHIDVPAFHEGFADLVALFSHFAHRDFVKQALAQSNGDVDADLLFGLGKQFGEAISGGAGGALRRAFQKGEGPDTPVADSRKYHATQPVEPHERGAILVAAVFETFVVVFRKRTEKIMHLARESAHQSGQLSAEAIDLLADAACKLGAHFLRICIRAIDYCPPVDIRFGSFLRAVITSDVDAVRDDVFGYRDAFIKAFRRRDIEIRGVRDLSEDSLCWRPPDLEDPTVPALAFGRLRFSDDGISQPQAKEFERRARALGDFVVSSPDHLKAFGLHEPTGPYAEIVIQSIRRANRTSYDGLAISEFVAEVTQERRGNGMVIVGGSTVVIGMDGAVRFIIRRRVDDVRRRLEEMRYTQGGGAKKMRLEMVHKSRAKSG